MTKPKIQIDDEVRDMTDAEFKEYKANAAAELAKQNKIQAEAEAKEIAKAAILDRIGLSADELKTILG